MIYGVRVTAGQEELVGEVISRKAQNEGLEIYSVLLSPGIRGYILVEAKDELTVRKAVAGVSHVKGVVQGAADLSQIEGMLEAKPLMAEIKPGMIVKLIAGPFKGEKARVIRVDPQKEEVTVELVEAAIKIPVTVEAQYVKVEG